MGKLIDVKSESAFSIRCKAGDTKAEIIIYREIGDSMWGDTLSALDFSEELNKLPKSVKNIDVRINSLGGDVFDGITIYNRLKQHKAKVTVYVDALAASIASIIALAGDEVIMSEGAQFMIHKPWTWAAGNSLELEDVIARLDDIEDELINIYKRKTKLERSEIKKMLAEETWLSAEKSVELGFADRTMENDEFIDVAASVDRAKWIKNKPRNFKPCDKAVKEKLNGLLDDMKGFLAR